MHEAAAESGGRVPAPPGPRVLDAAMTLATHLPEYLAAIDRRAAEEPDGYDPIKPEYFERAKSFLVAMAEHAPDLKRITTIVPTADGCIAIEWREDDLCVHIEVGEKTEVWVYVDGRVTHRQAINPNCPISREQVVAAVEGKE